MADWHCKRCGNIVAEGSQETGDLAPGSFVRPVVSGWSPSPPDYCEPCMEARRLEAEESRRQERQNRESIRGPEYFVNSEGEWEERR